MRVSVLILTHNESINIARCLASLSWCDDVVVVDSGSTDDTVDIARSYGARVIHRPFDNFANQRNFGIERGAMRNDWVLHLDADEVVTPQFGEELAALSPETGIDAFNVPSKLMLFGRWISHAGMYPAYQVRLGRRDRLRFIQVGHGQRENLPGERVATFPEPYLHYSFSHGMRRWLEKHVRYAKDEADLMMRARSDIGKEASGIVGKSASARRRNLKAWAARLPLFFRPAARFVYVYLIRMGFLDGSGGLAYAVMLSVYEGMIAIFAYESLLSRGARAIEQGARLDPDP